MPVARIDTMTLRPLAHVSHCSQIASSALPIVAAVAGVLVLGACSNSRSLTLTTIKGEVLRGSATTTLNGQYFVRNATKSCTGTFEGRNVAGIGLSAGRSASVTARCSDGKTGASTDLLYNSGSAQITFSDGSRGTLTLAE